MIKIYTFHLGYGPKKESAQEFDDPANGGFMGVPGKIIPPVGTVGHI
jgi:hypothetical protein